MLVAGSGRSLDMTYKITKSFILTPDHNYDNDNCIALHLDKQTNKKP